jgi:hypothetical protein
MIVSVPSWPEAAGPRESLEGKSPLKMPPGDHTFATFACKHREKTAIRRRSRVARGSSPGVSERKTGTTRHRERPAFQGFLTAKYR